MNWKCYLGCACAFALGSLVGNSMNSKKYLEGRLSACQEIIPTAVNPAVAERLTCMIKGNDVVVRLKLDDGEVFFSLDGKKKD